MFYTWVRTVRHLTLTVPLSTQVISEYKDTRKLNACVILQLDRHPIHRGSGNAPFGKLNILPSPISRYKVKENFIESPPQLGFFRPNLHKRISNSEDKYIE